ncbi:cobalamin-dependent protein [Erythrobacter sp. T5W1-R]|uniref:cobalamin B12-binding domain-containing protein n=1 Tax=Erythrobacter sp. T5W1-R TaxID=3101752 RepID=UPI002AFF86F6|nr:cobalamin-dependent protein [Erythrobacter sp. T5W1-R]MEA1617947.1 cobalamin-dependent protein [Erythrobacter sp. T5W1-R]
MSWRDILASPFERVRKRVGKGKYSATDSIESITTVIESEIIPRLLMAHNAGGPGSDAAHPGLIDGTDINRFALLPLRLEAAGLLEEVDALIERGASVEAICVELLAPAARRLGEMWDRDECDFIDVTMGLWRLQEVMREISARSPSRRFPYPESRSALFSPMPGDIHTFGSQMIEEVFARAGWQSEALVNPERRELLDRVAHIPFDIIGLTLTRDCPSAALGNLIRAIRSVSANPHVAVIIGGRVVNENPSIVAEAGADGTGHDALSALELAEQLILAAPVKAHHLR